MAPFASLSQLTDYMLNYMLFGGELDLVGGELDLVGGELDLIGGELDLVGGELDQVQSKWGRTRWRRARHGAKPV